MMEPLRRAMKTSSMNSPPIPTIATSSCSHVIFRMMDVACSLSLRYPTHSPGTIRPEHLKNLPPVPVITLAPLFACYMLECNLGEPTIASMK
ncbi:unnamed protein product [Heligmosomoides polygyrus]|uniref:Ovule protein n=1 Tax=Heligmosomoides polygyrus TaxID=6339 RepID=A0A183F4E2_HELPZ|nr:unnamed protein product [Heligmosomoides polygyrus]